MTIRWQPSSLSDDQQSLVDSLLENAHAAPTTVDIESFAEHVPEVAWRTILAILELPDARPHVAHLMSTVALLLSHFAPAFIDRLEAEAAVNPALRQCLGGLWTDPSFSVPLPLWERISAAAGTWRGDLPRLMQRRSAAHPLTHPLNGPPETITVEEAQALTEAQVREYARAWVDYQQSAWAWAELDRVAREDGCDVVWSLLLAIVDQGSDQAFAGGLSDILAKLLRSSGPQMIDRVEAEAARSDRFRECLRQVLPSDKSAAIWPRVIKACGEEPPRS